MNHRHETLVGQNQMQMLMIVKMVLDSVLVHLKTTALKVWNRDKLLKAESSLKEKLSDNQ